MKESLKWFKNEQNESQIIRQETDTKVYELEESQMDLS